MSNRQHTRENRLGLREALLHECRTGVLTAGDALPTVRELALKHGLSPATTQRVLKSMADEGILQLRQGAGAYISKLPEHAETTFVVVFGDELRNMVNFNVVREGFESEIAKRNASSLTLTPQTRSLPAVLQSVAEGSVNIGGAFYVRSSAPVKNLAGQDVIESLGDIPLVTLAFGPEPADMGPVTAAFDTLRFDDVDGARQTVRHLWRRGHRKLAFLGLHNPEATATTLPWSAQRAAGFKAAVNALDEEALIFLPNYEPGLYEPSEQEPAGAAAAQALIPLLREGRVKAVVCANQYAFRGLLSAARAAELPEACWPAIVAFDDAAHGDHLLSVVRLPWDDMGRAAATALWERAFGTPEQREAPPRDIYVPMRLVARLSCSTSYDKSSIADGAYATAAAY